MSVMRKYTLFCLDIYMYIHVIIPKHPECGEAHNQKNSFQLLCSISLVVVFAGTVSAPVGLGILLQLLLCAVTVPVAALTVLLPLQL